MSEVLRVASLGTSSIMDVIQDAMAKTDGLESVVIFSRDEERGREYAAKVGIPESMSDYDALLSRDDIDVIYIATPVFVHSTQAIKALKMGKHVIVEKPPTVTVREIEDMYEAAVANNAYFLEAITTIFMPDYIKFRSLIPRLGALEEVRFAYGQYSSKFDAYLRGEEPSNLSARMQGGALNDMGIYCIHAAVDLFGEPTDISYAPVEGRGRVDLAGTLTLSYKGCACQAPDQVIIETSKQENIWSGAYIKGERGWLRQDGSFNDFINCSGEIDGEKIEFQGCSVNRMVYEQAAFRDCILGRDDDFFEQMYAQSRACVSILEKAHKKES